MFVYIHFNVPPTRITDLVRNVSDEKIYYWYGTVTFVYVFAIIYLKDFSISFSRVIIVQYFETVTFLCIIWIQTDLLCYFLLNKKGVRFKSVQSSFLPIPFHSQTL